MRDYALRPALRPALRNKVYEYLGKSNRRLLEVVVRDAPHLEGAAVGAAVLRLLDVPEATEASRNPERFFDAWVRDHGPGHVPRRRKLDYIAGGEAAMEYENLKWVGLAILVAVAGGALWHLLRKSEETPTGERATSPAPPKPKPVPIRRLAVAIFAGKLPAGELDVASVADLVARATYWWVGKPDDWNRHCGGGAFQQLDGSPTSDDALIVVLVDVRDAAGFAPTSRAEASSLLRSASSRGGHVEVGGKWTVTDASALTAVFRR